MSRRRKPARPDQRSEGEKGRRSSVRKKDVYSYLLKSGFWGLALTMMTLGAIAQKGREKVLLGFENVHQDTSAKVVSYEQRLFRNPYDGFMGLRYALGDTAGRQAYVPMIQGVPFAMYLQKNRTVTLTSLEEAYQRKMGVKQWFPFKDYKFDFWLQPQFIANFGNFNNPVESKTNILLNTQLNLSRGLVLNTGVVFPLINDIDSQPLKVRLAPTYLNKFAVLSTHNFISASAGFFYSDQYGVNVQYRHSNLNKPWSYGFEWAYSGYYRFVPGYLEYAKPSHLVLLADIAYRMNKHDISFKLSGGQYMHNDRGARIDMIRQFTRVEIAFFGLMTTNGTTIGFNFAIPIPPGNIIQGKRARLRTTDEFRWEYIYTRGNKIGEKFRLNYQLDEKLRQYHQSYWQNQAKRF
ncbi:hypothetical protein GVN16_05805 [Emticicia sp. CRIBPO]|uniref:YjbH domain-containing protein n=1 Tax=Emticicia sp. CRIBPO TaxID=2683258 RepID=UPI0014120083|nr:YjbH domain-containing protein [Emticicia sp. CRIBPO]NBA85265.1 hypothetical protein [Emticicia sp. CRIBPO]